jgi:4'-phosphopantetheinyl transferase EntD
MIEALLPPEAASAFVRGDDPRAVLFPEEAAAIQGAVESRVREFTTGRWCARQALQIMGLPPTPILRGPKREPVWPAGVVGSITHCRGYRAAAVAMRRDLMTIGIDAEINAPLPAGVLNYVSLEQEKAWLATAPAGIHWDRLLFSAKESVFKAWFPLARKWLGFEHAMVTFQPASGTFYARLLIAPPPDACLDPNGFEGRFLVRDGFVFTAIATPGHQQHGATRPGG